MGQWGMFLGESRTTSSLPAFSLLVVIEVRSWIPSLIFYFRNPNSLPIDFGFCLGRLVEPSVDLLSLIDNIIELG